MSFIRRIAIPELGPLEKRTMDLVWQRGELSVRDAGLSLDGNLAYTTVMTTLDRLHKKGLLNRRKVDRAFLYSPRFTAAELERRQTGDLVTGLLQQSSSSRELLISCLVDAVGQYDAALLEELERQISAKREEMKTRGQS
jgi:predicted transcriptional regulator